MQRSLIERTCEVCPPGTDAGHARLSAYGSDTWPVGQCTRCGFVYLTKAPDYSALVSDEAWEKNHKAEEKRRRKIAVYRFDYATRFRLKIGKALEDRRMKRLIGATGNVLDIGCGGNVERLPHGVTPFGVEISEALHRSADIDARKRGGRVIHAPAVEAFDAFEDGFFDAILMRSYLEHEINPRAVLEKSFAKLRPGGVVYIKVPDYGCVGRRAMGRNWCGFRFPDHVNYFTRGSLERLAGSIGFRYRRLSLLPGLDDNLYALLSKPVSTAATAA